MKVLVSVAPTDVWQSMASQFALNTVPDGLSILKSGTQLVSEPLTISELNTLLLQHQEAEIVTAYESAETMIGRLLAEGKSVSEATAIWRHYAEGLLTLQRQNRRSLKLFNLMLLTAKNQGLPDWLQSTHTGEGCQKIANLFNLIAAQSINQDEQLQALYQRLLACSLPLSETVGFSFDLDAMQRSEIDALQKINSELPRLAGVAETSCNEIKKKEEENQFLVLQMQQVQQELDTLYQSHNKLQQRFQVLQNDYEQKVEGELSQQNMLLQENNAKLKLAEEENQLLLLQLQHVQEELENYYFKLKDEQQIIENLKRNSLVHQSEQQKNNHTNTAKDKQQQREVSKLESQLRKTKARAAAAEHRIQLLQQELDSIHTSAVWKTAAPVRVLGRMLKKNDKARLKLQQETALILTSEYFDLDWYLARYPDVVNGNINPAEHYLRFGAAEGRMPGPLFDGNWYLQRYPDVALSGINPLLHFIKFGQQEGRSASPKLLTDNSQLREES